MAKKPNRTERRKAKPLARAGALMWWTHVVTITSGPRHQFYWFATEQTIEQTKELTLQEIIETQELHGPFDTAAEAQEAAQIAVVGKDCKVTEGGMWNPAWDKPQ